MHQSDPMRCVEGGGDLLDDLDRPPGIERSTRQDVLEILTVDQTHVHVQASLDLTEVVNRHDVRII